MSATPKLVLRLVGLRKPVVREMVEMVYEFDEPFVVDAGRFTTAFGDDHITPLAEAIDATVEWYRAHPAPAT